MKLTAKGHNPYLEFARSPDVKAAFEAEILFDAAEEAAKTMLTMTASDNPLMQKSAVELWMAMRNLHEKMSDRLESLDLTIQVAGARIEKEYVRDLLEEAGAEDQSDS